MTALPDTPKVSDEQKSFVAFILGVGSLGFFFVGIVALLLSPRYHGSFAGQELLVAGAVAVAIAVFLIVALVAVWFDMTWLDRWDR